MENFTLHNGLAIPKVGFGTYKSVDEEGEKVVQLALEKGYRLIDTAAYYGNEKEIGLAINQSEIPREEILITTKVWRENLGYKETLQAYEESKSQLGTNIDILLIHWPANEKNYADWQKTNLETWRAMEELYLDGKLKAIGVCNFNLPFLQPLLDSAQIVPMINQIEFHPGFWQPEVTEFCQKSEILIQAWSPLARGKILENEFMLQLAKKYGKSVSQICLKWIVQKGVIPIPKSSSAIRMNENLDLFHFELAEDEIAAIDQLPTLGFSGEKPELWPERLTIKND